MAISDEGINLSGIPVIMLAGSSNKDKKKWAEDPTFHGKAYIDIAGKPMIEWVQQSIKEAGLSLRMAIGEWVVFEETVDSCLYLKGHGSLIDNLWDMLERLGPESPNVLVVTCDIPAVRPETLQIFAQRGMNNPGILIPVVRAKECEDAFPGSHSTSLWIAGERWTMGNCMMMNPASMLAAKEAVEYAIKNKKNVFKLAWLLGLKTAIKIIFNRFNKGKSLDFPELEFAAMRVMNGMRVWAYVSHDPGLGYDGDSPESCRILAEYLRIHKRTSEEKLLLEK